MKLARSENDKGHGSHDGKWKHGTNVRTTLDPLTASISPASHARLFYLAVNEPSQPISQVGLSSLNSSKETRTCGSLSKQFALIGKVSPVHGSPKAVPQMEQKHRSYLYGGVAAYRATRPSPFNHRKLDALTNAIVLAPTFRQRLQ